MAVVLDSNAVIGFLDADDALHVAADEAVRELALEGELVVSVVTYAEVLTGARLGHHGEGTVKGFFNDLISAVIPVDVEIADRAASLRSQKRKLRMPDALILATAEVDPSVELIVSGDATAASIEDVTCPVRLLR